MKKTEIVLIIVFAAIFIVALTACSAQPKMKLDCKGAKHYKQKGGFYLQVKTVGEVWEM